MSVPVRHHIQPTVFSPLEESGRDTAQEPSPEARDALAREQAELQREVILWQRWPRYLAILVLCAAAILLNRRPGNLAAMPLLVASGVYLASVFVSALAVRRAPHIVSAHWLSVFLC